MRAVPAVIAVSALIAGSEAGTITGTETSTATGAATDPTGDVTMEMKRLTPVVYVEEIEPVLEFWTQLGFEVTAEVPEGDRLGFVILENGSVQLMYQTRASVEADVPDLADTPMGGNLLFIEVDDLDAVAAALVGAEVTFPRRTTFYGADEIGVREPGGNAVTFAQFAAPDEG